MGGTTTSSHISSGTASRPRSPMPRSSSSSAAVISRSSRSPTGSQKPWRTGLQRKPVDKPAAPGPYLVCDADQFGKGGQMGIEDLDRIRFVTRHFRELQGFRRLVPAGLILLSLAGLTLPGGWFLSAALLAGACALLL